MRRTSGKGHKRRALARDTRGRFVPRKRRLPQKDKPPELWPWAYVEPEHWTPSIKMWVYIRIREDVLQRDSFEVGYYKPDGLWYSIRKTPTEREAQELVHYLNGGSRA